ncbi:uncharacterized protein LOC110062994 [Orbicella faveolata]|uniref:uncharacterized protein LOC110062994 n=1 Tax=Orbicella faveolata TaxID=48498 RepID=UPI0009E28CD7|nr:uncharacterized protein LOC110062994 [Orbicella faveolata]
MANADLKDDGTNLPRVHNALYFPDLTVFGPEISTELYPMCGSLGWKISTQADADRVPVFNYCIVEGNHQNGNVVNILKRGDWITLINGTSTTDKDEAFFEKVKTACCDREDGLSLVIKTPAEQQEFHLWDPKPVKIDIKTRRKILPCTLEIFYPDLSDTSKTFTLVHKIQQQKLDLKGLKRGDKIIAINDIQLQNKTYKELDQITSQLKKQQQLKLTVERRQWRQNGYLTKSAIDRPTHLIWRPLQAELKKKKLTKKLGFKIESVENPLEQPCIIITHISAGEKPAAMSPYLNPGCKIIAINGQGLNGLSFEKVKAMLQRAPASVMLTIQEPTCLLHEKRFLPSGGRYTWPVEVERAPLCKSISEGQFPLANEHYICSMCSHKAAGQNITADAQSTPLSVLPQSGAESGSIQNGQELKDISPVATTPASSQPRGSDETKSAVRDGLSSSTR